MDKTSSYLKSTIGQKQIMALSGLAWAGFVLTHMLGNLLLFAGAEAYNKYSHALTSNPFIYLAEAGLVVFLLGHVIKGLMVTIRNKSARDTAYYKHQSGPKQATLSSRTMIYQGLVILVFIVLHLITFKYGPHYSVVYGGVEMRDIYRLVIEVFESPMYTAWYLIAVTFVGFHLSHGVYSACQSLGLYHEKYTPWVKRISVVYGILITIGFMSQPIFAFLQK